MGLINQRDKKGRYIKGHNKGILNPDLVERNKLRKGEKRSEETKRKMSEVKKGKPNIGWFQKGHIPSKTAFQRGENMGEKNPNWKDGITTENDKTRATSEIRLWRKAVLERDNFTCQKYGIMGGKLIAHHINNFSEFPELRTAIDNGITLSEKAHKEFHKKYGYKNNTKEQIKEFLKD